MKITKGPTLADIAAELTRAAELYPSAPVAATYLDPALKRAAYRAEAEEERRAAANPARITIGRMTITCRPYRECVLALAAKYDRATRSNVTGYGGAGPLRFAKPSLRRPQDADAQLAALETEHAGA